MTSSTVYDARTSHYSYQLPTPRSSSDSEIFNFIPLHSVSTTEQVDNLVKPEAQLPETPPRSRTPSPDRQKGVVENVKQFLKGQHQGTMVQVFQDIGMDEFDQLGSILSDSGIKYDFDADSKTLIIHMPTPSHEECVEAFHNAFKGSMVKQKKRCGRKLKWRLGLNVVNNLEDGSDERLIRSNFIPDVTIYNNHAETLVLVEVAHTQSRNNALTKIEERMASNPSLLGAILLNVNESPAYGRPPTPTPNDYIDTDSWDVAVGSAPVFGPIRCGGRRWVGSITCSVDIRVNTELNNREGHADIIPESATDSVDTLLQDLWEALVHKVAGDNTKAVPFAMDWDALRHDLNDSLSITGFQRYLDWFRSRGTEPQY